MTGVLDIAESLAGMSLAIFLGISLPVVGAGITRSRHVSPKDTILGFAMAVSACIAASAIRVVGRTSTRGGGGPTPAGRSADSSDRKSDPHPIDNTNERKVA